MGEAPLPQEGEQATTPEDSPRVRFPPPFVFAGMLLLGLWWDSATPTLSIPLIVGIGLIALGLWLIAAALGLFRRSETRPEPWKPASTLVIAGIYSWTRNPMYLGMAIVSFGVGLLFESFPALSLTVVATLFIDRAVIAREEAYLRRRFGDDYLDYQSKVGRWF